MKLNKSPIVIGCGLLILVFCCCSPSLVLAQSRDHLTEQEVELVRDAQILDKRIDVFIKAIDRRMLVLNGGVAANTNTKQAQKESEKWGELPRGTRAELLGDIAGILDEAITNIEDVSVHDERNPLIPKALRKLSAESTRILDQLTAMRAQAKVEAELGNLEQAMENAQSIIDAANKLPPPAVDKERKAKDKSKETH